MNVTAKNLSYQTAYAIVDERVVAIMVRSPFTGEYCYGLRVAEKSYGNSIFAPPFTQTHRKTALAAAKVVAAAIG